MLKFLKNSMKEAYLLRRFLHKNADVFFADSQYRSRRLYRRRRRHPDLRTIH